MHLGGWMRVWMCIVSNANGISSNLGAKMMTSYRQQISADIKAPTYSEVRYYYDANREFKVESNKIY